MVKPVRTPRPEKVPGAKGRTYETSRADERADKKAAKARGISARAWEGSAADKRMDKAMKAKMGKKGK